MTRASRFRSTAAGELQSRPWARLGTAVAAATCLVAGLLVGLPSTASAAGGAVIPDSACNVNEVARNDDGSSPQVQLPFTVNVGGTQRTSLWVNNNGNVTFDAPQSTYTPFGLASTQRQIIAPFFADVDTRNPASDTVKYGWGTGLYEGRTAFCANWVNIGYYPDQADKTNSFQLLLVDRSDQADGAFDIVFNYDRIQWETGSASGGTGGSGGTSAAAGFSNGAGSYFQLPGSLEPGSFLDGGPQSLTAGSLGSTTPGRYVYRVREGGVAATKYVALGDSFQSGEGEFLYYPGTDTATNQCHRSPLAYGPLLVDRGVVPLELDFGACSGAVMGDLSQANDASGPPFDDGISQYDRLGDDTRLVTIGISGNDLGFANVLTACTLLNNPGSTANLVINGPKIVPPSQIPRVVTNCAGNPLVSGYVAGNLVSLASPLPTATGGKLDAVFREVRERAPYARIIVVTYPQLFKAPSTFGNLAADCFTNQERRFSILGLDRTFLNATVRKADSLISNRARAAGLEVFDASTVFGGDGYCASDAALNGLVLDGNEVLTESFHPNTKGHRLLADAAEAKLAQSAQPTFRLRQGETRRQTFSVSLGNRFSVNVSWPGSDVQTTLISPSGRRYDRTATPSQVQAGPTWERFTIENAEKGTWTISSYGARLASTGEDVTLDAFDEPAPNLPPSAVVTRTTSGSTVTFDARGSSDLEGGALTYAWDFGDGATATGPQVSHTYPAGSYLPALVVTDPQGAQAFWSPPGGPLLITGSSTGSGSDLKVALSGPTSARKGASATYTMTITNRGTEKSPAGTAAIGTEGLTVTKTSTGSTGRGTVESGSYKVTGNVWPVPALSPGQSTTVSVTGTVVGSTTSGSTRSVKVAGVAKGSLNEKTLTDNGAAATTKVTS